MSSTVTKRIALPARRAAALAAAGAVGLALPAPATELGATSKALGTDTVLVGLMAPPGTWRTLNTITYYNASRNLDGSGNPRPGMTQFEVDATLFTSRLSYVWSGVELFGANIESRIGAAIYGDVRVRFDQQTPGGTVHVSGSSKEFFPGVLVAPALLGWRSPGLHQIAGVQLFFPTQPYHVGRAANLSTGYSSIAPVYFATWFPAEGFEVDASVFYLFNGRNGSTNYRSGQEFSMDYAVGYSPAPRWQGGLNGYVYQQTTDDTRNGTVVGDGNRGRVLAIGPYVRYQGDASWGLVFKWDIETWVENRTSGNRFFVQFGMKL